MQWQQRRSPRRAAGGAMLLAALLLGAASAASAADLYSEDGDVQLIEGGQEAFKKAILSSHGAALVKFFSPNCPHCVALAPEYKKVAANLKGIATVAAVDCSQPDSRRLCETYGVRGYPTLKLFAPDLKLNPYTGEGMKDMQDYKGESGARAIAATVTDLLHDRRIATLSSEADLEAFAPSLANEGGAGAEGGSSAKDKGAGLARVLLFTDKAKTTVLYKALSLALAGRLRFGQAVKGAAGEAAAAARLGVEEYPTLVVIKPDGTHEAYTGALKALPLREFLGAFASETVIDDSEAPSSKTGGGGDAKDARSAQEEIMQKLFQVPVERLTPGNLTALDEDEEMWLLGVHGGDGADACKESVAAFDAAAKAAQAVVRYGTLAAKGAPSGARGALKAMGLDLGALEAAPCKLQVVLLPYGAGKADLDEYKRWEGGLDNAKALQAWILEEVPDNTVVLTTEQALQMFMQTPPNNDGKTYGKIVLLASKAEVPGVYKALAMNAQAKGLRFAFGWIPAGAATAAFVEKAKPMLRVTTVPGLVAAVPYSGPDAPKAPPGSVPMAMEPYRGSLKYQVMFTWVRQLGIVLGLSDEKSLIPDMPGAPAAGGAPVTAVTSQQQLQDGCYSKGALCLLGLLDGASDKADEQAKAFEEAAAQAAAAQQPGVVSFARLDASSQRSLRDALGVRRDELPALAVLSAKRLRFALAPPSSKFGPAAAKELLEGVLHGKVATAPLQELPRFVEGGDEDAGEAEVVEDEFDLSEIMAEESIHLPTKEEQLRQAEEELKAEAEAKAAEKAKAAKSKKGKSGKKKKKAPKDAPKDEL